MLQKHSRLAVLVLSGSLVVGGVLLILINLALLEFLSPRLQYFLSFLLLVGGLAFAWFFFMQRTNWWQLIPSFTCLSLAAMLYMTTLPDFDPRLSAAVLLWGMALSFLLAYVIDTQERWWGLIMAGLMAVLGAITFLSQKAPFNSIDALGAIAFGGLGLVFLLLFLQGDKSRFWWAPIPGFVMALYGFFAFMTSMDAAVLAQWRLDSWTDWWPAILVGTGILVVVSAYLFPQMYQFSPPASAVAVDGEAAHATGYRSTADVLLETDGPVPGSTAIVLHELQR